MAKYLYGANVKAVQQFIFQTDKLTEIIGASELVEQICTSLFGSQIGKSIEDIDRDPNCIIAAAGIVKYIFDNETECQTLVRVFPKEVFNAAPGIVFNQAVVKLEGEKPTTNELRKLEDRLKTQRNKAVPPLEIGLRIMERSRRTGLPGIKFEGEEVLDKATKLKREGNEIGKESLKEKLFKTGNCLFPSDIKELASKGNYIAIIHADGNNLGKAIRDLNETSENHESTPKDSTKLNKDFSRAIEEATLAAARTAVLKTFGIKPEELEREKTVTIHMRPVILGGDDFTVICNAEYALELTKTYLAEFETESKLKFKDKGLNYLPPLTACAGIAYIKTNYPFHYAAKLAEDLCAFSKNIAKQKNPDAVPACLTFHKVQSSFVGEYKELIERELTATATKLSFCGGPYFISKLPAPNDREEYQHSTVEELLAQIDFLRNEHTPTSKLREWISTCHISKSLAIEDLERIIKILNDRDKIDIVKGLGLGILYEKINTSIGDVITQTTLYDAITIHSLNSKT